MNEASNPYQHLQEYVPAWPPRSEHTADPWQPGYWITETQTIRPKQAKKRYPSRHGYGDYMGRKK